jgi:outer membrane protein OmpA-like peptidoglycan-associated protein/tetratricopeptide (TPR) repeat protein
MPALLLSSCAGYHIRKGDQALALLAYSQAEKHYDKALRHRQDRDLLLHAAEADNKQNKIEEAAAHYAAADSIKPLDGTDAFEYGKVLMSLGDHHKAEDVLLRSVADLPQHRVAVDLIGSCQGYLSFYEDSARYTVTPLPIPGLVSAFSGTPYPGGLLVVGDHDASGGKRDPWTGESFLDLYGVPIASDGTAGAAVPIPGVVNGPYHEGSAVLSANGRTLYFTRSNYYDHTLIKDKDHISNLKLFRATLGDNGEWGNIREFAYNSNDWSTGQPALSSDGNTLFFVSDRPGGIGGKDLWYCTDTGSGWSDPRNMGSTINTAGDEMFPTVVGDVLYFSSTGHVNMGGLDIFETHREGDFWSDPKNMGYPVNSTRDDFGLWLDSAGTKGYLSSARSGTDGIYALSVHRPVFAVEGTVTNAKTGKPILGAIVALKDLTTGKDTLVMTDHQGHYYFDLAPNTAYQLVGSNEGMLTQNTSASTVGLALSAVLKADLALPPVEINRPIAVKNIYYDFDKWDIRPDAARELDKLAEILKANPGLTFELSSHTDSRGGDTYNLVLSDARAKSAVDYLVRHGVDPDHLIARGYGETQLVNGCSNGVKCTEEQHQANRRTDFKVISRDAVTKAP